MNPLDVDPSEKVELVVEASKAGRLSGIKSSVTRLGIQRDRRVVVTSDGIKAEVTSYLVGFAQISVASEAGKLERVYDSKSRVAGWEFLKSEDVPKFSEEVSELALKAVKAPTPPAGTYRAVADPDLIGLILHEAFGHAVEGDLVASGTSILKGKLGSKVASEAVNIIDSGVVEGGYFVPFDDEGNVKREVKVVEEGYLKGFLTHLKSASELGLEVTGNGRVQDFMAEPIVRQTNFYMAPGDHSFEELIEDVDYGIYLRGRGGGGGQVDTGAGTFTFNVGPSYIIRKGEPAELVRGVVVSGFILETLKGVEAVGKELKIRTSVFGGCGKDGQLVRVGFGDPHVRISKVIVGGR